MPFRTATPVRPGILPRGVHLAPYFAEDGEIILVAVTSQGRRLGPVVVVPHGGDRIAAAEALWDQLEAADPVPHLKVC